METPEDVASELPVLLLVEDEGLIAVALEDELVSAGYRVVVVHDGQLAMDELRSGPGRFKAVVTDIRLGGGPDGWAVAHAARETSPNMSIVYISGDSAMNWAANGVPNSVMLPKPFAPAQLVTAISALITSADLVRLQTP